jgi:dolichol-phosphate mannosyltransferase
MDAPRVIVVLATYNEAATIGTILDALSEYEVVIVDDSSEDGTGDIARRHPHATVISRPPKSGIVTAYLDGFRAALTHDPTHVVQMDAGLTHKPADVPRLVACADATGAGLVLSSRFVTPRLLSHRSVISLGAAFLMRRAGVPVTDATGGFRCWRADILRRCIGPPLRSAGFAFQLELLHRAREAGGGLAEVPIDYTLTNSSFSLPMAWEALRIYSGFWQRTRPSGRVICPEEAGADDPS